jgi:glutamate synthase (NADPH/NADH) small chain
MEAEGVKFRANANIGGSIPADELRREFDAVVLAGGSTIPRDLKIPGRELRGVHFAMEYLTQQNRRCEGDAVADAEVISASGRRVVIIGGGDTGADCLGTAHRQGAASVHQFELLPRPPDARADHNPWPTWPQIFRVSTAHEEGGERLYSVATTAFTGRDGRLTGLTGHSVMASTDAARPGFAPVPGTEFTLECDLVLLAMGFLGPERSAIDQLGVALTDRGTVARDQNWMTNVPGVFAAGDMQRGQSLIVWAIAEGRSAARGVDQWLMGQSQLPAPV